MAFYQPFYYPYFSARAEPPRSYAELNQKLVHIQEQQKYRELLEADKYLRNTEDIKRLQFHEIHPNLMPIQSLEQVLHERAILGERQHLNNLKKVQQMQRESAYLNKIERMRRERELLDNINRQKQSYSLNCERDEKYMTDDELIRIYQSGIKKQQYEEELENRRGKGGRHQYGGRIYQKENNDDDRKKDRNGNRNDIYIKDEDKTERYAKKQEERVSPEKKKTERKHETVEKREYEQKRSYIEDLRESKGFDRLSPNKNKKGQTVDILRKFSSPFNQKNKLIQKKRALSKKPIKVINQTMNRTFQKEQKNKSMSISYGCPPNITSEAMQKINNRIKVSRIVYKDSKKRTNQHETNHLFNTFEIQLKGRKQIKNKINNHPGVLKKHLLVAQSR